MRNTPKRVSGMGAFSAAEQAERQHAAELALENDPFVQSLKREFGATIVPGSVRPV